MYLQKCYGDTKNTLINVYYSYSFLIEDEYNVLTKIKDFGAACR